jgi:hypothetical protein
MRFDDDVILWPTEPRTPFYRVEQAPGCPDTTKLSRGHLATMSILTTTLMYVAGWIDPDTWGIRTIEMPTGIRLDDAQLRPLFLYYKVEGNIAWVLDIELGDSTVIEIREGKYAMMYLAQIQKLKGGKG